MSCLVFIFHFSSQHKKRERSEHAPQGHRPRENPARPSEQTAGLGRALCMRISTHLYRSHCQGQLGLGQRSFRFKTDFFFLRNQKKRGCFELICITDQVSPRESAIHNSLHVSCWGWRQPDPSNRVIATGAEAELLRPPGGGEEGERCAAPCSSGGLAKFMGL